MKKEKGITLVALIVTIIILLILAGISISALTNQGLFGRANEAKQASEIANIKEQICLDIYEKQLQPPNLGNITKDELVKILETYGRINYEEDGTIKEIVTNKGNYTIPMSEIWQGTTSAEVPETPEPTPDPSLSTNPATTIAEAQEDYMFEKTVNSQIEDEYGNSITVPAGFKITADATTANEGIVIKDAEGNQFVWIPVGKIYTDTARTEANAKTIGFNRYTFDSSGNPTAQNDNVVYTYWQELATSTLGNTTAKDINAFKTSVGNNKGYYIGRYEARINSSGTITEVGTDNVWNYIAQPNAATAARNMYKDATTYTSDLMNSYAWDTATLFLQTCGDNPTYSRKNSVNTSLATTGTNNQTTKDVQCNVYDMASNVFEWTTETYSLSDYPCVTRGDDYRFASKNTSNRGRGSASGSYDNVGFRPLLYL